MKSLLCSCLCLLFFFSPILAEEIEVELESDYVYVIDPQNNQVFIDQGSNEIIYPASMTKMMTLIVAIENLEDENEILVLDYQVFKGLYEANASLAGFSPYEEVSVKDCLYGLFLPSGAECTKALAIRVAGSENDFVEMMNQKAQELGMNQTQFMNTTGLHHKEHVTTLQDLSILLNYCLKNERFYEIFTTKEYIATSGSKHKELKMKSTLFSRLSEKHNDLILGGKTGYTNPAGLCLASFAKQGERQIMMISAHAPVSQIPHHLNDAVEVYETIFETMHKIELCNKGEVLQEVEVMFTLPKTSVTLYPESTISLTLDQSIQQEDLTYDLQINESLQAPLKEGDDVGTLTILYEDKILGTCKIEVRETIEQSELAVFLYDTTIFIQTYWKIGLLLFACLCVLILFKKRK